jgi:hypothetical protein
MAETLEHLFVDQVDLTQAALTRRVRKSREETLDRGRAIVFDRGVAHRLHHYLIGLP